MKSAHKIILLIWHVPVNVGAIKWPLLEMSFVTHKNAAILLRHSNMRIHFIAIGGSAMHNVALALCDQGHLITGSDDQILEPSRSRLERAGILPESDGWFPEKITSEIDVIVLGMHARNDNPELLRALELGVVIQSYPEFLYHMNQTTRRIVVGGSHGKTTVTAMMLHVFRAIQRPTNFMVGAQLDGFDRMVQIDRGREWCILEGDEYLSSPLDRRPKFFWYRANFTLLTGIAWDHINVFPTEENYIAQFDQYLATLAERAVVVWCEEDAKLQHVIERCERTDLTFVPYRTPKCIPHSDGTMRIQWSDGAVLDTRLIGTHNMQNLAGARALASQIGISGFEFDRAIQSFTGAARRLETLHQSGSFVVFRDFAHAPSKLKATVAGVKASYPNRALTAIFELHTFSSLNRDFLPTYRDCMAAADEAIIYFDPSVLAHKKLPELSKELVKQAFGTHSNLTVVTDASELQRMVDDMGELDRTLLLMSSGWLGHVKFKWNEAIHDA